MSLIPLYKDEKRMREILCTGGAVALAIALTKASKCDMVSAALTFGSAMIGTATDSFKKEMNEATSVVNELTVEDLQCECEELDVHTQIDVQTNISTTTSVDQQSYSFSI